MGLQCGPNGLQLDLVLQDSQALLQAALDETRAHLGLNALSGV